MYPFSLPAVLTTGFAYGFSGWVRVEALLAGLWSPPYLEVIFIGLTPYVVGRWRIEALKFRLPEAFSLRSGWFRPNRTSCQEDKLNHRSRSLSENLCVDFCFKLNVHANLDFQNNYLLVLNSCYCISFMILSFEHGFRFSYFDFQFYSFSYLCTWIFIVSKRLAREFFILRFLNHYLRNYLHMLICIDWDSEFIHIYLEHEFYFSTYDIWLHGFNYAMLFFLLRFFEPRDNIVASI